MPSEQRATRNRKPREFEGFVTPQSEKLEKEAKSPTIKKKSSPSSNHSGENGSKSSEKKKLSNNKNSAEKIGKNSTEKIDKIPSEKEKLNSTEKEKPNSTEKPNKKISAEKNTSKVSVTEKTTDNSHTLPSPSTIKSPKTLKKATPAPELSSPTGKKGARGRKKKTYEDFYEEDSLPSDEEPNGVVYDYDEQESPLEKKSKGGSKNSRKSNASARKQSNPTPKPKAHPTQTPPTTTISSPSDDLEEQEKRLQRRLQELLEKKQKAAEVVPIKKSKTEEELPSVASPSCSTPAVEPSSSFVVPPLTLEPSVKISPPSLDPPKDLMMTPEQAKKVKAPRGYVYEAIEHTTETKASFLNLDLQTLPEKRERKKKSLIGEEFLSPEQIPRSKYEMKNSPSSKKKKLENLVADPDPLYSVSSSVYQFSSEGTSNKLIISRKKNVQPEKFRNDIPTINTSFNSISSSYTKTTTTKTTNTVTIPINRNRPQTANSTQRTIRIGKNTIPALSEVFQRGRKILNKLRNHRYGFLFNTPVDPESLNIPTYFDVIKNPMDLGTIQQNMDDEVYQSLSEWTADIRLVWSNAKLFNGIGSEVANMAETLEKIFESDLAKLETFAKGGKAKEKKALEKQKPERKFIISSAPAPSKPAVSNTLPPAPVNYLSENIVTTPSINPEQSRKLEMLVEIADLTEHITEMRNSIQKFKAQQAKISKVKSRNTPSTTRKKRDPIEKKIRSMPKMTIEEKRELSEIIKQLPHHHIPTVIHIIQTRMPAINDNDEEIEIDIDKLDDATLRHLERYVKAALAGYQEDDTQQIQMNDRDEEEEEEEHHDNRKKKKTTRIQQPTSAILEESDESEDDIEVDELKESQDDSIPAPQILSSTTISSTPADVQLKNLESWNNLNMSAEDTPADTSEGPSETTNNTWSKFQRQEMNLKKREQERKEQEEREKHEREIREAKLRELAEEKREQERKEQELQRQQQLEEENQKRQQLQQEIEKKRLAEKEHREKLAQKKSLEFNDQMQLESFAQSFDNFDAQDFSSGINPNFFTANQPNPVQPSETSTDNQ